VATLTYLRGVSVEERALFLHRSYGVRTGRQLFVRHGLGKVTVKGRLRVRGRGGK
jgi:hypothetical protein